MSLERSKQLYEQGKLSQSYQELRKHLEEEPTAFTERVFASKILHEMSEEERAERLDYKDLEDHIHYNLYFLGENSPELQSLYSQLRNECEKEHYALFCKALSALRKGKEEEALQLFKRYYLSAGNTSIFPFEFLRLLAKQEKYHELEQWSLKFSTLFPQNKFLAEHLVLSFLEQGRPEEALKLTDFFYDLFQDPLFLDFSVKANFLLGKKDQVILIVQENFKNLARFFSSFYYYFESFYCCYHNFMIDKGFDKYSSVLNFFLENVFTEDKNILSLVRLFRNYKEYTFAKRCLEKVHDKKKSEALVEELVIEEKLQGKQYALARIEKLEEEQAKYFPIQALRCVLLEKMGRKQEAYELAHELLKDEAQREEYPFASIRVMTTLARLAPQRKESARVAALIEKETNKHALQRYLGELYDDIGEYAKAFKCFQNANEIGNKSSLWELALKNALSTVIQIFNRKDFQRCLEEFRRNTKAILHNKAIFIVGMPRSGTSLTEQILSMHPQIHAMGETHHFYPSLTQAFVSRETQIQQGASAHRLSTLLRPEERQCFAAIANIYYETICKEGLFTEGDTRFFTDKMPQNFLFLGFIRLAFPEAKIIHCVRHPLDTCISCFTKAFAQEMDWSKSLDSLAFYYNSYLTLMEFWTKTIGVEVYTSCYEDLVNDPEFHVRRLLDYCGLEWDARCLDFYKSKRFMNTASYNQVRQPLYKKSIGRYKNYLPFLETLIEGIDLPENSPYAEEFKELKRKGKGD